MRLKFKYFRKNPHRRMGRNHLGWFFLDDLFFTFMFVKVAWNGRGLHVNENPCLEIIHYMSWRTPT